MKVAMKLTLDGLIRALRWKEHELAEDVEHGYRSLGSSETQAGQAELGDPPGRTRERKDDRPGR
ncbi:MAG: hypothetical protein ABS58_03300 [Mesorhizobium sp. SCN 65-20]|nr:MAG: hypothetical protein ABS58_03300 [Mesorhizobium sp. SCN 65-20]